MTAKIFLLVHICFSTACWITRAHCPTTSVASIESQTPGVDSVLSGGYCYYIANGLESCEQACQRVDTSMHCSEAGLLAVMPLSTCVALINDFGLQNTRASDYSTDASISSDFEDFGCSYGDFEDWWVQINFYDLYNPATGRCRGTTGDVNRHLMCACEALTATTTTITPDTMETTTTMAPDTTTTPQTSLYIMGDINSRECPAGSARISTRVACEQYASYVGHGFEGIVSYGNKPPGCVYSTSGNKVLFNYHATGGPISYMRPICVQGLTPATCIDIRDRATCISSIDDVLGQACTWCCDSDCGDSSKCHPHEALMSAPFYSGKGANLVGYDTCQATWLDITIPSACRCDDSSRQSNEILTSLAACQVRCELLSCQIFEFNTDQGQCTTINAPSCNMKASCQHSWVRYNLSQASITTTTTIGTTAIDVTRSPWGESSSGVLKGQMTLSVTDPANFVKEPNLTQLLTQVVADLYNLTAEYRHWVQNLTAEYREDRRLVPQKDYRVDLRNSSGNERGLLFLGFDADARRLGAQKEIGDIDVEWKIVVPPGSEGEVVVELLVEKFNARTMSEATSAINALINRGMLGDPYSVNVTWKYTVVEDVAAHQVNSDIEESSSIVGVIVTVLSIVVAFGALLSISAIAIWMKKRAKERADDLAKACLLCGSGIPKKVKKNRSDRFSINELLHPPNAITAKQGRQLRDFASNMIDDFSSRLSAKVFVSYSPGSRESDATGYGPGSFYAAAILKLLTENGISCFSELMLPEDHASRKLLSAQIGTPGHSCEVLLVLQTKELYNDRHSLLEIYLAQEAQNIQILPLRFEESLPATEDTWPSITRQDVDGMLMVSSVVEKFCRLNSVPSPPYTVVNQPDVLKDIITDLKLKVTNDEASPNFSPLLKSVMMAANANDDYDEAAPTKLGATSNDTDVVHEEVQIPISLTQEQANKMRTSSLPVDAATEHAIEEVLENTGKAASAQAVKYRRDKSRGSTENSFRPTKSEPARTTKTARKSKNKANARKHRTS